MGCCASVETREPITPHHEVSVVRLIRVFPVPGVDSETLISRELTQSYSHLSSAKNS